MWIQLAGGDLVGTSPNSSFSVVPSMTLRQRHDASGRLKQDLAFHPHGYVLALFKRGGIVLEVAHANNVNDVVALRDCLAKAFARRAPLFDAAAELKEIREARQAAAVAAQSTPASPPPPGQGHRPKRPTGRKPRRHKPKKTTTGEHVQ